MLVVTIDRERCMASGMCVFHSPKTFDIDDEGGSVVIDPSLSDVEGIEMAALGCPTRAIVLEHRD